ncbi:type IV pilus assembly PilZ [Magnetococcus marinus MC-1]|uniref:Type IV pilus assembly PilZ n=1 Tax=Magnetococcus marinus (strain ATCC BAA-1437 / JCM 17883 / MC-1) TaxID=156889 RepID=A0LCT2_MAGMM|nr:PilZ domain-containing protein [Magnetococcus marinus]ABK45775.1 type IV pilus assembly PilZ [Magnetococcus marinus MC-1]
MNTDTPHDRRIAERAEHPNGRRQYTRVEYRHAILLKDASGQSYDGSFNDISLKGMLFLAEHLPEAGTEVGGELLLGDVVIELHGTVVLSQADRGAAIRFMDIDLESFSHLRTLVSLNLGDAERIDRELFDSL